MNDHTLEHAQHLLRHLNDPLALKENPLTEAFDAGVVRKMLERLCAKMAGEAHQQARDSSVVRRYVIFRRCDLSGEPHCLVASDLGISRRQFYRERRVIAQRVSELFSPHGLEPGTLPGASSPSELVIWLKRLALETRYSDILQQSGRDPESRDIDVIIRRRIAGSPRVPIAVALLQYAGIRLARRELGRGNAGAALMALDLLEPSLSTSDVRGDSRVACSTRPGTDAPAM